MLFLRSQQGAKASSHGVCGTRLPRPWLVLSEALGVGWRWRFCVSFQMQGEGRFAGYVSPPCPWPQGSLQLLWASVGQENRDRVATLLALTSLCKEIFSSFFLSMSFSRCIFSVLSVESSFRSSALMARIFSSQPSFTVTSLAFSGSRARIFSLWWAKQGQVGELFGGSREQLGDRAQGHTQVSGCFGLCTQGAYIALNLLLSQGQSLAGDQGLSYALSSVTAGVAACLQLGTSSLPRGTHCLLGSLCFMWKLSHHASLYLEELQRDLPPLIHSSNAYNGSGWVRLKA